MSPAEMAAIHAAVSDVQRPWTETEFADLIAQAPVLVSTNAEGFALCRYAGDEAELLTIAVRPEKQNQGVGRALMAQTIAALENSAAQKIFLEVAADNVAAIALYTGLGFSQIGRRPRYYTGKDGAKTDALVMALGLPVHGKPDSQPLV